MLDRLPYPLPEGRRPVPVADPDEPDDGTCWTCGQPMPTVLPWGIRIDEAQCRVWVHGKELELPPIQYRLLMRLARTPGREVSRVELKQVAWLDVHPSDVSGPAWRGAFVTLRDLLVAAGVPRDAVYVRLCYGVRLRTEEEL